MPVIRFSSCAAYAAVFPGVVELLALQTEFGTGAVGQNAKNHKCRR